MQHSASYTHSPAVSSVSIRQKKGKTILYRRKKMNKRSCRAYIDIRNEDTNLFLFSISPLDHGRFYRFYWSCFQNSIASLEKNMQHRREEYADNLSRRNMKPARQPPFSLSPSLYMNFSFSFFESARGFSISLYGLIHQFWSGTVPPYMLLFCFVPFLFLQIEFIF